MSLTLSLDDFGNRQSQIPRVHIPPQNTPGLILNNDANSPADQFAYDAAGDVTNDGRTSTYTMAGHASAVSSNGVMTGHLL